MAAPLMGRRDCLAWQAYESISYINTYLWRALVHERMYELTCSEVEHKSKGYRDWQRRQRFTEYCQQQQCETQALNTANTPW